MRVKLRAAYPTHHYITKIVLKAALNFLDPLYLIGIESKFAHLIPSIYSSNIPLRNRSIIHSGQLVSNVVYYVSPEVSSSHSPFEGFRTNAQSKFRLKKGKAT